MTLRQIGALQLDPYRQLTDGSTTVALGKKALWLLSVLVEADGRVVTKEELMEAVWPGVIVQENALQVHLSSLRKALGSEASRLGALRGTGYQLLSDSERHRDASNPPARAAGYRSLAVMPFANLTGDATQDYIADGMSEELICTLSSGSDIKVPARTSTFAYRGHDRDVRAIARDLGVELVLEGSIRQAGARLRVTAQLIDAANGFYIWSHNYDREYNDLLTMQEELASTIASALRVQLYPMRLPTNDQLAFEHYLQARQLWSSPALSSIEQAIAKFRLAIACDSGFARAWADLGEVIVDGVNFAGLDASLLAEARSSSETALVLDPTLLRAKSTLGSLAAMAGKMVEADALFVEAIASNALEPNMHIRHAMLVLAPLGHWQQAHDAIERAYRLAPAWSQAHVYRAIMASLRDSVPEALGHIRMACALGYPENVVPIPGIKANAAILDRRFEDARALCEQSLFPVALQNGGVEAAELYVDAHQGRGERALAAQAILSVHRRSRTRKGVAPSPLSNWGLDWLMSLGAIEAAFEIAHTVVDNLECYSVFDHVAMIFIWKDAMKPLRSDPRFGAIAQRMRFFEYWQVHGPPDGHEIRNGRLICL